MKYMENKFYQHGLPQPFHISVGAVLFDEEFKVCVHHFTTKDLPPNVQFHSGGLPDFYHLMRESLEGNEPLHDAVHRGIYEEYGATGIIERYLGAMECQVQTPTTTFQKITLYHAVRLKELGERPHIDEESVSKMELHTAPELLEIYRAQAEKTDRPELQEGEIIQRFMHAYNISATHNHSFGDTECLACEG
jgi:hypothetical protein